jgi:uncharacterized Tic20 family protein
MQPQQEERTWAMVAHAGGPAGIVFSAGLLGFLVPLIVWLAKKDESEFINDQGKEALNFQLTLFLLHVGLWFFVLVTLGIGLLVAIPLMAILWLVEIVLGVLAAIRSYDGQRYRYPLSVRLIS